MRNSLYGTRDAALNWANTYCNVLVNKLGFKTWSSPPCSCHHARRGLRLAVHGDDFVVEGSVKELMVLKDELAREFEIKYEVLGREEGQTTQI